MGNTTTAYAGATFPLLSRFFGFWEDIEIFRRDVQASRFAPDGFRRGSARGREQLADALRDQRTTVAHTAPSALPRLEEALYVMAATADELFIGLNWEGADDWRQHPLEAELFGTRRAGQEIFERIDRLIDGSDPFNAEMAAVYLTALELGFKGTFADADGAEMLLAYETRLRSLVGRSQRLTGPLVPQCYAHTSVAGSGRQLPDSRVWWWALLTLASLCLVAVVITTTTRFRGTTLEQARQKLEASFDLATATR